MKPKGVVSLFIGPDGRVVAHAADFHPDRPGGYTEQEAQQHRAREALHRNVLRAMCNWDLADAMSAYTCDGIIRDLCESKSYRIEHVAIGHDDD